MRLRKKVTRPQRLEDEIAYGKPSNDPTRPAFPHLLQSRVVPFNPDLPAAAFPSRPIAKVRHDEGDGETFPLRDTRLDESSGDDFAISEDEPFPTNPHLKLRQVPCCATLVGGTFEDEMATSDEDSHIVGRNGGGYQGFADDEDEQGQVRAQASTINTVKWKDLHSAVQLAIVDQLSQTSPLNKVYDMIGLYAQDLGDIRRLSARYNYQNEMEDYLIYWMQQDQLRGILRTDHTSSLRGAPEAYQEFQTESYMRKIRQEIDESLLQATRAEVDLGKRFLAQQGIERDMIGHWGHTSTGKQVARLSGCQIEVPTHPKSLRNGMDSGYASATITPNKRRLNQEAGVAIDPDPPTKTLTTQQATSRSTSNPRTRNGLQHQDIPVPVNVQQAQQHHLNISDTKVPRPADDVAPVGSSGRSRRSVRRTSRYEEAITELKLRGSCGDGDSDYNLPDERDNDSEEEGTPMPSPRLRITLDHRIIGLPAPTPNVVARKKASDRAIQTGHNMPHQSHSDRSRLPSISLQRTASPLPLPRVIVRPPKPMPKPKQASTVAQVSDDVSMNRFQQNLLGVSRGNQFTTSLLRASERETAKATPWITPRGEEPSDGVSSSIADEQRPPGTVKAPAFSPITERFSDFSSQEQRGSTAGMYSSSMAYRSKMVDLTTEDVVMKSPDPAPAELTSTTAMSKHYRSTGNDRTIVTETGSPVPARQGASNNKPPIPTNNAVSTKSTDPSTKSVESNAPPSSPENRPTLKSTSTPATLHRRLDPTTGNVVVDEHPPQIHPHTLPHTRVHAPPPPPLPTSQNADTEIQKAATDLPSAATKLTRSTLPTSTTTTERTPEPPAKDPEKTPPPTKAMKGSVKAVSTPSSYQDGQAQAQAQKEKRKYTKSETQRKKEAVRRDKLERERKEREGRMGMLEKGREGQVELDGEGKQAAEAMEGG